MAKPTQPIWCSKHKNMYIKECALCSVEFNLEEVLYA